MGGRRGTTLPASGEISAIFEMIVNRGESERLPRKRQPAADSKPGAPSLRVQYANRNAIVAAATMRAMLSLCLSLRRGLPRAAARVTVVTGRCFINTPIVNCYHLIKSHFPRAYHDSADGGDCFGDP